MALCCADNGAFPAEPADGDEHVFGLVADHVPKRPHQLQAAHQQDGQHQGQGTEGQRKLLLHGLVGLGGSLKGFGLLFRIRSNRGS